MGPLTRLKRTTLAACLTAALGCSSVAPAPGAAASPSQGTPLSAMAGRPLLVLPVQRNVGFSDSLFWSAQLRATGEFLSALDDSIAAALGERGVGSSWTFARAITASARRNAGMTADPHALAAEGLRRLVKSSDAPLSEPLASQIRSLVSLGDARYVILPAMLRFENQGSGARGSLLVYLIDARTARIQWSGEVASEVSRSLSPATAGSIAQHLADLVVAR